MGEIEREQQREEEVISVHRKYIESLIKHKVGNTHSMSDNERQRVFSSSLTLNYQSRDVQGNM